MSKNFRPGEPADYSGIFRIVGVRGGYTGEERTVVYGEPFPPTLVAGQTYEVVRKTHTS
jgi:hypothetical protein